MRNYFGLDLKGGRLAGPFFIVWALFVVGIALRLFGKRSEFIDWDFFWSVVSGVMSTVCVMSALCILAFFFVRGTVRALSLSGERFEADYDGRKYASLCAEGILLSLVTFGIYTPWFVARLVGYFGSNTFFRFKEFRFRGSGSELFSYVVLLFVLPDSISLLVAAFCTGGLSEYLTADSRRIVNVVYVAVVWLLKSIGTVLIIRWLTDFKYGGRKRIQSVAGAWHGGLFVFGQVALSAVTLGMYYPMALLRMWHYFAGRTVLGGDVVEDRFGFAINPGEDYLVVLGQMLLCIVTLGIYFPWAYARIAGLLFSHTYADTEQRSSEPMPPAC